MSLTSEKIVPYLERHAANAASPADTARLALALVVLGPQDHDGHRYKAVRADTGEAFKGQPVDKDLNFDASNLRIVIENLPAPAAPAQ